MKKKALMSAINDRGLELTFVAMASGSRNVDIPAAAQVGDLALVFNIGYANLPYPSFPGFSWVGLFAYQTYQKAVVSKRVLTESNLGTTLGGMNGTSEALGVVIFRPSRPISAYVPHHFLKITGTTTGGSPHVMSDLSSLDGTVLYVAAFGYINKRYAEFSQSVSGLATTDVGLVTGGDNDQVVKFAVLESGDGVGPVTASHVCSGSFNYMASFCLTFTLA